MHFRPAIVIAFLALGCQDKKPAGPPVAGETPAVAETTTTATATTAPGSFGPASPPLEGNLDGKPFRPDQVSMDGTREGPVLVFRQTDGKAESSIGIVTLPVPEGAKLSGREWTFGGKVDDPVVLVKRPEWDQPKTILGPDYALKVRLTNQTKDSVEGDIDLTVKNPAGTGLKGRFRATYRKSPTAPLGPDDAPYIHGKITLKGAKKTEKLAAGYVGVGTDGKPCFNEAGFPVDVGHVEFATAASPEKPTQLSWLSSTEDAIAYRHLNVPPGDFLVYVRRDTVMSAWRRIKLKDGDQQTLDLTVDPANTGEVVVTLPESDAKSPAETSLALVPAKADLPELGLGSEHYFNVATVKMGEKTVKVSGIPGGKYRAVRGADEAEVEVVAGKSVAVTLMHKQ
jgi:hypothetical protein